MLKRFALAVALICALTSEAQTVAPIVQPYAAFLDAAGLPCSGCKLYSYVAGTTVAKPTYTDSLGVSQNTNPIVLDVAGGAVIWMGAGAYKFVLKDAVGTTIRTVDNVPGSIFASGTFLPLGGGTLTGALNGSSANFSGTGTFGTVAAPIINGIQSTEYLNTAHPPLAFWDVNFHNCRNAVINIQVHGDSRSIVDTTVAPTGGTLSVTFGQKWVDQLRNTLNGYCGSHGTGLVPFRWGTGSFASLGMNLDFYTAAGSFVATDTALGPYQPNTSDPMVITATSNGASVTFNAGQNYDHLNVYCVSGTGINPWTITVDGSNVGTCGVASGTKRATLATSSAVNSQAHAASLSCPTQPCEAYGMEAISGTTGVSIHNLSVGSASMELFGFAPSTQNVFSALIPGGLVLDIINEIANEPGNGYSTTQFQTSLNSMINWDRTVQANVPSILIVAPLQDGIAGQTPFYPILAATATAQNTAFVDLRDRWGTAIAPAYLFGSDGWHENLGGHGEVYSAVAGTLIDVPVSPQRWFLTDPIGQSPALAFRANQLNDMSLQCWGSGNGAGLQGSCGFYDASSLHFVWSTNALDDMYGWTPPASGNVYGGAGSTWSISHLGAATFTSETLGNSSTPLSRYAKYTAALSAPSAVAANWCGEQGITVTGVQVNDIVLAGIKPTSQAGLAVVNSRTGAANTIYLTFCNTTAASITPTAAETYTFVVVQ